MIDTHKALRKAYYDALNGQLSVTTSLVSGKNVPVYDEVAQGDDKYYVILSTQTATENSTLTKLGHETTMLLDIVAHSISYVNKDVLDQVAQQILSIVIPSVGQNGLSPQPFLGIDLVIKESDQYFPVQTTATGLLLRRLLRFSQFIHEL